MKKNIFNTPIFLLCFGLAIATLVSLSATDNLGLFKKSRECSANIRLTIGGHMFAFPRGILQHFKDAKREVSWRDITCNDASAPAPEVASVFLLFYPEKVKSEPLQKYGGFVTIGIGVPPSPHESKDTYEAAIDDGRLNGIDLSILPIEDGFRVLTYSADSLLLIPTDKTFLTPKGNPVVFYCSHYAGRRENPLHCGTNIAWKDNIGWGVGYISDKWVPRSELRSFYNSVSAYIETLQLD